MLRRIIFLSCLLLGIFLQQGVGQFSKISGIINEYASVETLYRSQQNNVDSLLLETGLDGNWEAGDTVLVYCVKGANLRQSAASEDDIGNYDPSYPSNVGKYAFFIVNEIVEPLRQVVVLNSYLKDFIPMAEGEVIQLIKVKSYRRAEVTGTLTSKQWDGSSGGVVALFVQRTLRLSADIDVSGTGLLGAVEDQDYAGTCSVTDTVTYDSMFYQTSNVLGGKKGEGITRTNFNFLRGKARNINGGGGGNARMSGGGGGSNYSRGGDGGFESSFCEPGVDTWGRGGYDLVSYFYVNGNPGNRGDRVFLGGGGGTGTQVIGRSGSSGGDGGGLVFIIADSIEGNGYTIRAEGLSVSSTASAAGGGGGGGGGVILDVHDCGTTLNLRAVGGDGGDTYFAGDTTGPGGGGGGGFYWLSAATKPDCMEVEQLDYGLGGKHLSPSEISYGASVGGTPGLRTGLVTPLRGFIFNTVPDEYKVCSDVVPETIIAGAPRGGDGPGTYEYEWLDSTKLHSWQPATYGTYTARDFAFSSPLSDTTWFRRVVKSGAVLPRDTSFRIAVYVHPEITGNVIAAPDTVCSGDRPPFPFIPDDVIQGGPHGQGEFTWQWIRQPEGSSYEDATGPSATDSSYHALPLTVTTNFARIAYSGACVDTSAPLLVKVWEKLTGNAITPNDTVCFNTSPELISGAPPQGGEQTDIRYLWQSSADTLAGWNLIGGEGGPSYQSGGLTETTYFRRIVLSGSDDACKDTSNVVEALNIPLISGNTISGAQTVCTDDQAGLMTGSVPGGGYQGLYSYLWESRTLSTPWAPASGDTDVQTNYDPGTMTGDTTWFRRVVGSGRVSRDECLDYSDSVVINVLPSITNNLITAPDTVQCQWETAGTITQDPAAGSEPGGGATQGGNDPTRRYQWETASGFGVPGSWEVIPGADQLDYDGQPQLVDEEDLFFRRIVYSGPEEQCRDTAVLRITVHTQITANTIEPFDSVCFNDNKLLLGAIPAGEPGLIPVYTWRDLDAEVDIPGSDQEDFTSGPYNLLGAYHYHRRVAIGECQDTSNVMQITVMQLPGGLLTDDPFQACERDTALAIDLNMDQLQTYVTPWEVTLRNQTEFGIGPITVNGDGPLPVTLDIGDLDNQLLNYEIESIFYSSVEGRYVCMASGDSIGGMVPITVFRQPDPQILVDGSPLASYEVCNTTMTLGVDTDNGTGSWTSDPPGTVLFTPSGTDEYLASIPNDPGAFGNYQLIFTSEAGDCFGEAVVEAIFDEQPAPAYAGADTMIFLRSSYQLRADPPTAGTGTWTVDPLSVIIEDENDPRSMAYQLDEGETTFTWTVTNGVCETSSHFVTVFRNDVNRFTGFSPGNQDMSNEYFIIQGLAYADEFQIRFFNALGNTVRTVTHETVDELVVDESLIAGGLREDERVVWDGLSDNGNPVPSGTYYYVINFILYQRDWETGNITRTDAYEFKDYVVLMRD